MKRYLLAGAIALTVPSASLQAGEVITVNFTASVDQVVEELYIFPGVSRGDPVTGFYSYDTNAADTEPENTTRGFYRPAGHITMHVGTWTFESTECSIDVRNNEPCSPSGGCDVFDRFHIRCLDFAPSIPGAIPYFLEVVLGDTTGAALDSDALPTGTPVLSAYSNADVVVMYTNVLHLLSGIASDVTSLSLKGGTCAPDGDGDRIQTSVDVNDAFPSTTFVDTSTTPSTTGSYSERGDQDLCASDEPWPQGVRVEAFPGGGSAPATVNLTCWGSGTRDVDTGNLTSGDCLILTCVSGPRARVEWCAGTAASAAPAAAGLPTRTVELDLLRSGLVIATLTLPEGNAIDYTPQTAEVTAPPSNNATLTLVDRSGGTEPLPPGGTTTVPYSAIPAASAWGLAILALALLVGARVYFSRRASA